MRQFMRENCVLFRSAKSRLEIRRQSNRRKQNAERHRADRFRQPQQTNVSSQSQHSCDAPDSLSCKLSSKIFSRRNRITRRRPCAVAIRPSTSTVPASQTHPGHQTAFLASGTGGVFNCRVCAFRGVSNSHVR